jgi:hypothetical protein
MERKIQEIELPGGQVVLARVGILKPDEVPYGQPGEVPYEENELSYEDVGALDHLAARVDQLNELVTGVGAAVLDAARAVRPDEVSTTFGVELADSLLPSGYDKLSRAPATAVPYFCWHDERPSRRAEAAVGLGYPVMLWSREPDHANCPEFYERAAELLREVDTADQLLERVREMRLRTTAEGRSSWASRIAVFYDPPDLVPPGDLLEAP